MAAGTRLLVTALTTTLVAATAVAGLAPVSSAAEIACADVVIIGARGSGEPQTGTAADGGSGMGAQSFAAAQRIAAGLAGRASVAVLAAQYPASSVQSLASDMNGYFQGLEAGVAWTKQTLTERGNACHDERVVLLGYSQGAMVMHRTTQDLIAAGSPVVDHIDGVLLLADGDRDSSDGTRRYGTARRGSGIARQLAGLSGARATPIPAPLRSRIHNVCDRGDSVCNFTSLAGFAEDQRQSVHVTHYRDSRPVRKADRAIIRQVRASLAR